MKILSAIICAAAVTGQGLCMEERSTMNIVGLSGTTITNKAFSEKTPVQTPEKKQPLQIVNISSSFQGVTIKNRDGTSQQLNDEEIKQKYPGLYIAPSQYEGMFNMRIIGKGSRVQNYSQGDVKNGDIKFKIETTHGVFSVNDNNSYRVTNYVGANKDVSHKNCSDYNAFITHLKDCGITVIKQID